MELKDKIALITGGSRGLGRSIAMQLSGRDAVTVICGRNEEDLSRTSTSISRCSHVVADVSSFSDVQRMFLWVKDRFGRIDILVNNAGVGIYKPFLDLSEEDLDVVMNVNFKGTFFCSQEAARAMRDQGEGCIVNILSGAAEVGVENLSVYCASKHALLSLTKWMKKELSQLGIRVVHVSPGYIDTGFFDNFPEGYQIPRNAPSPDTVAEGIVKTGDYSIGGEWIGSDFKRSISVRANDTLRNHLSFPGVIVSHRILRPKGTCDGADGSFAYSEVSNGGGTHDRGVPSRSKAERPNEALVLVKCRNAAARSSRKPERAGLTCWIHTNAQSIRRPGADGRPWPVVA